MPSIEKLIFILFIIDWLLAALGYIYVHLHRRPELSRTQLLLAGPLVFFVPGQFVAEGRARIPKLMFGASLILFFVVFFLAWSMNN